MISRKASRVKRKARVRAKIFGTFGRPRLSFYKSNKHVFAQIIDDEKSLTLVSAGDGELVKKDKREKTDKKNTDIYFLVGELVARKALAKKISKVAFDRGGFKFHGLLAKFVEGARSGGLKF